MTNRNHRILNRNLDTENLDVAIKLTQAHNKIISKNIIQRDEIFKLLTELLLGHLLNNVICSAAIQADAGAVDSLNNYVSFNKSVTGTITVQGRARVTYADDLATNGVIHTIDNVLVSECGRRLFYFHFNQCP